MENDDEASRIINYMAVDKLQQKTEKQIAEAKKKGADTTMLEHRLQKIKETKDKV